MNYEAVQWACISILAGMQALILAYLWWDSRTGYEKGEDFVRKQIREGQHEETNAEWVDRINAEIADHNPTCKKMGRGIWECHDFRGKECPSASTRQGEAKNHG